MKKIRFYLIVSLPILFCSCITFRLNDDSMQSKNGIGVNKGDMLIAIPMYLDSPERGDVVIVKVLADSVNGLYKRLIKRIVGLPNDTVLIRDGKIWIDGKKLSGQLWTDSLEYVAIGKNQDSLGSMGTWDSPAVLGAGEYFVIGDNSSESYDSRNFGGVKIENISHHVMLRYWPAWKIGKIN